MSKLLFGQNPFSKRLRKEEHTPAFFANFSRIGSLPQFEQKWADD